MSPDVSLTHAIIAGVNKCGTTSLYRYLSDHPGICPSSVKETRFFHDYVTPDDTLTYHNYRRYFEGCPEASAVALEASPSYFTTGAKLNQRIATILPDVRLIVMLRNPMDRLLSYFRSAQNYDNYATPLVAGYTFEQFAEEAVAAANGPVGNDEKRIEFRRAIEQGNYAKHANTFHDVFPHDRVYYCFLEDFRDDTRAGMRSVCDFLAIDKGFFDSYDFTVENKSRHYRSRFLQRFAFHANQKLETFLNRYPGVRRRVRSVYLALNEQRGQADSGISSEAYELLNRHYESPNRELRRFLREHYRELNLPAWLTTSGDSND